MFLAPHHVANECGHLDEITPFTRTRAPRWMWIAGHRFRDVRWF